MQGVTANKISTQLSPRSSTIFGLLPLFTKKQLLLHLESDDSAQLAHATIGIDFLSKTMYLEDMTLCFQLWT